MARFKVTKTVPVGPVGTLEIVRAAQSQIRAKLKGKGVSCKFTKPIKGKNGYKFKAVSSTTISADATVPELKKAVETQIKVPGSKVSVVNLTAKAKRSDN